MTNQCFAEFGDHTAEVTQVQFSKSSPHRAFSASLEKTFKVYDIAAKCTLKTIQAPSPINKLAIDVIETQVYLACDNQNVYAYSLELPTASAVQQPQERQKRTLQHRKKVTAMCMTFDSQYLVTGDSQGLIYVWNVAAEHQGGSTLTSPKGGNAAATAVNGSNSGNILHTFELHKDKGPITNLLCIYRPLSLYGLTANMKAYEPTEFKPFNKVASQLDAVNATSLVPLSLTD